jgi:hypothetical protein
MKITPRTTLVIIAAMFLLPLLLAWLMYSGVLEFHPESTRNKGILVSPPVPFEWSEASLSETGTESSGAEEILLRHWVVLYPLEGSCGSECRERLSSIRQVHLASGRHRSRIRLAVLDLDPAAAETGDTIRSIYDEYLVLRDTSGRLRHAIESAGSSASPFSSTYLVDPLGNIMMVYPPATSPNDLKEDLTRLMKWSKLDEQ